MDTFVALAVAAVVFACFGFSTMRFKRTMPSRAALVMLLACVGYVVQVSTDGIGAALSPLLLIIWMLIISPSFFYAGYARNMVAGGSSVVYFHEEVVQKLEYDSCETAGLPCAVIYVSASHLGDVEKFKAAILGVVHDTGKEAALKFVGDVGRGEFVMVLFAEAGELRARISTVAHSIHASNIDEDELRLQVPWVRIGACVDSSASCNFSQLLRRAALASRMNIGNELWREYDSVGHRDNLRKEEIIGELRGALKREELSVVYQPIVHSGSGNVAKFEALVRWRNRRFGDIGPDEFIPLAEQSGLMNEIGDFVLTAACLQLADWRDRATAVVQMSVNVSQCQLETLGYAERVRTMLERLSIPAEMLELEVTERILVESSKHVAVCLADLKVAGVCIAIDDFGTGTSALSVLSQFNFDTLKIDRSFLTGLETDERRMQLYQSICSLAKLLGMSIVAEGVETVTQAQWLCSHGVHYQQGWLHGKPISAARASREAHSSTCASKCTALHDSADRVITQRR